MPSKPRPLTACNWVSPGQAITNFLPWLGLLGGAGLAALANAVAGRGGQPSTGNLFVGIIFAAGIAGTALAVYMAAKSAQQPPSD